MMTGSFESAIDVFNKVVNGNPSIVCSSRARTFVIQEVYSHCDIVYSMAYNLSLVRSRAQEEQLTNHDYD